MADSFLTTTITEISIVKRECLGLLTELRNFYPITDGIAYPETYRLLVLPMLYSVWERCFTLCHAVTLRLMRDLAANPQALNPPERAVWLMQAPFYQSLIAKALDRGIPSEPHRIKRGHFSALSDFLEKLDDWNSQALDRLIDTETLVMTFSNVNPDVVELNARAIGIWDSPEFQNIQVKLGRLHDLVGRRNGIGHGATMVAPPNSTFVDLLNYTEWLIGQYCDAFVSWIHGRFQPKPEPLLQKFLRSSMRFLARLKKLLDADA